MRGANVILVIIVILLIIGGLYWAKSAKPVPVDDNAAETASSTMTGVFNLTSSAFSEGGSIPSEFTCDGNPNMNPPLSINNTPAGTKSLAITMYDPDVPTAVRPQGFFDHWVVFNIPATTTDIAASSTIGIAGSNGSGKLGYTGPCPPPQYEPKEHRYIFTIYALDTNLNLPPGATRSQFENAATTSANLLGKATLTGRYQKK